MRLFCGLVLILVCLAVVMQRVFSPPSFRLHIQFILCQDRLRVRRGVRPAIYPASTSFIVGLRLVAGPGIKEDEKVLLYLRDAHVRRLPLWNHRRS